MGRLTMRGTFDGQDGIFILNEYGGSTFYAPYEENYHKLNELGFEARRGQQYCGANGDADVIGIPGIHIECKRVENLNIHKAMAQAIADAREGETPMVFFRNEAG